MSLKRAVVTGASRGIGRHVAFRLAESGFQVALLSRNEGKLRELAAEIEGLGTAPSPLVLPGDVGDISSAQQSADVILKEFEAIDLLFNNAGTNHPGTVELSPEAFRVVLETNLQGAFNILHLLVPRFKQQKFGNIINIGSVCSHIAFAGTGAYSASKFGLLGLSEALHRELAVDGVKVTAICPSWVNTSMAAHSPLSPEQMLQPEDIFQAVTYLMSTGPNVAIRELTLDCRFDIT